MKRATLVRDPILLALALAATAMGLLFIFDAGYARSLRDARTVVPRDLWMQLFALIPSFLGAWWVASRKPETWMKWSKILWILTLVALALCMVPGIGVEQNGAHRWIQIWKLPQIQPAEFAKLTAVLYLAGALAYRKAWPAKIKRSKSFALWLDNVAWPKMKRALPLLWVLLGVLMIELEPDLGTAAVVLAAAAVLVYVGGVSWKSLVALGVLGAVAFVGLIANQPYRLERITAHGQRWSSTEQMDDVAFQTVQSEVAMASGGLAGVGIGAGRAKHVLPATTTDFIMATVAEEWGLIGALIVLALPIGVALRLLWLAQRAKERFQMLVLTGVGSWIGVQACVNAMMANGFLPPIGIPLPFVSYGGSSLMALWLAVGICQSMVSPASVKEAVVEVGDHRRRNRRTRLPSARSRASVR